MKLKLHFLTTLLIFSSSFMNLTYAQLKKTYYINAASQLTTGSYNGCGSHYTNWNDEYFGFSWTDNLAPGTIITDLKIEINIGMSYMDYSLNTKLNDIPQGSINDVSTYYDCEDRTNVLMPYSIQSGNYIAGGLNTFTFSTDWGSVYLCKTPALNNSFAKITVTYEPIFTGGPTPTVSSLSSNSGKPCSNVTIYGTHFNNSVNYVQFNDALATSFSVINDNELIATVPANATTGPVRIYTNGGVASSGNDFTVITPALPEITAISTNSGTVNNTLIITGSNLSCVTEVTIGGAQVKSYTNTSDTEITAILGYGSTGTISVTTPGGTSTYGNFTYFTPTLASQVNINGNTVITNTNANVNKIVDSAFTISSNGMITDFTVSISDGYTDGDILSYEGTLPVGVTTSGFNSNTGVIMFEGAMLPSDWQEFLRRVTFRSTTSLCFPKRRKISFIVGKKYFNPLTNHFYEYMPNGLSWSSAKSTAAARSYFGRQGYLITITSKAENNFIWKVMSADAWIGGTDNYLQINEAVGTTLFADQTASEGKYYWVTGPEKGQQFSNQNAYQPGGVLNVNGQYQNWSNGEPNDWPGSNLSDAGQEDYAQIYSSGAGTWNDLSDNNSLVYIIEYGDMPNDNTSNQVVFTKELDVNGSSAGSITGGNVSVCEGTNSTTLTLSNMSGSVVRWESSFDNFLTSGNEISNTTNILQIDNISQTTYYRAVVNSTSPAVCNNLSSSSVVITLTQSIPGSVNTVNNTICEGGEAECTLLGNQGDVLKWEMASDANFTSPTTINQTTTSLNHTMTAAGIYYFRAQVQNNQCGTPVWSNGKSITVNSGTPPVGGTVSSDEHLAGNLTGTIQLIGNTGTVTKWQYSTDNGLIWIDMNNTSTSYTYNNSAGTTTMYRAVVSNAGCGTKNSQAGTVRIYGNNQYVWKGNTNTEWNNTGNWLETGIPVTSADLIISETAQNNLVIAQDLQLNNIDFNGSNRKILLGNYNLTLSSVSGTDASNYIQTNGTGNVRKRIEHGNSFTFPVGNTAYNPVMITNNSGSTDEFRVKVRNEVLQSGLSGNPLNNAHVQRTWDIDKGNPNLNGGAGIDFVFNWNNGEIVSSMTTPALFHYSTRWDKQTGPTTSSSNSLTYTGYTGTFSPFAIIDGSSSLPVTWLDFSAKYQQNKVFLQWQTATEQNSKDFIVQHSSANGIWENIGAVLATGNSDAVRTYRFSHNQPSKGNNKYRLIQRDMDGQETMSKTLSVYVESAGNRIVVYPTMVTGGIVYVKVTVADHIYLYNGNGALIQTQRSTEGLNTIQVGHLGKGIYYLRAGTETTRIIVQ